MLMLCVSDKVPFEVGHGVVVVEHRPAQPCVGCGAAGQLVCAGCGAWYCRRLCQAAHWTVHSTTYSPAQGSVSVPSSLCEYWGTFALVTVDTMQTRRLRVAALF